MVSDAKRASVNRWRAAHPEQVREMERARRAKLRARRRQQLIDCLGGKCACHGCGWHTGECFVDHPDVLECDHVVPTGAAGRVDGDEHYSRLLRDMEAGLLQLLCSNCHRFKSVNEWRVSDGDLLQLPSGAKLASVAGPVDDDPLVREAVS